MKHVRKYLPILLVLLLAIGMAGCGSSGGDTGDAGAASSSSASADTSADTSTDTGDAASAEYEHGTIDGNVYTNDFFGFSFAIDDGWSFSDEEALRQLNQSVSDFLDNDSITEALQSGQTFIDMQAANDSDPVNSINLTVSYAPGTAGIEDINDASIKVMKNMYENAGFENIEITKTKAKVNGGAVDALVTTLTQSDVDFCEKQFFLISGDYLGTITISGASEEECDKLLSRISLK